MECVCFECEVVLEWNKIYVFVRIKGCIYILIEEVDELGNFLYVFLVEKDFNFFYCNKIICFLKMMKIGIEWEKK